MSRVMKTAPLIVLCALIIAVPSVWANWVQDGTAICTATWNQYYPTITSDGAGGAIVTWMDSRSGGSWQVYAQRLDASGAVQWTANGVALCPPTSGDQNYPTITSDGAGGAIVTWYEFRGPYAHIYAQRVNGAGAIQWAANGVTLCEASGYQENPTIISDGAGGLMYTEVWAFGLRGGDGVR